MVMNFILIPRFGPMGAANVTVASYFVVYMGTGLFYRKAHWLVMEQIKNLLLVGLVKRRSVAY